MSGVVAQAEQAKKGCQNALDVADRRHERGRGDRVHAGQGQETSHVGRDEHGLGQPRLEPRRRAERALLAAVQEAYVLGVSTRRVEDLVEALGIASLSRTEVSRICVALDAEVAAFRSRSLAGEAYPYLWFDATYVKVRDPSAPPGPRLLKAVPGAASRGRFPNRVDSERRSAYCTGHDHQLPVRRR